MLINLVSFDTKDSEERLRFYLLFSIAEMRGAKIAFKSEKSALCLSDEIAGT